MTVSPHSARWRAPAPAAVCAACAAAQSAALIEIKGISDHPDDAGFEAPTLLAICQVANPRSNAAALPGRSDAIARRFVQDNLHGAVRWPQPSATISA